MKTSTKSVVILFIISITFNSIAQNLAYNKVDFSRKHLKSKVVNKALEDGKYFYDNSVNKIIVEINGDEYKETYPNNEFIKAKIKWVTNNSYKLVITEIKKPNLPFKKGTKLKTEIVKIKGNKHFYKSQLADRNWSGKLIKL